MIPILNAPDYKEFAKRERYKQIELARRDRIFNAKKRQIGIDYEALQQQILEKKEREKAEKAEELKYLQKQFHDVKIVERLDQKELEDRKMVGRKINEYRLNHQKFEDRREFDLNDPNRFKKDIIIPDPEDSRFGISSLQRFEGMDSGTELRRKVQAEQQQTWLLQQMLEKQKEKRDILVADAMFEETLQAQAARYRAIKDMEEDCKKKLEVSVQEYNKAMAVKKLRAQIEEIRLDMEDKETHKINQITSDFLSESKESVVSNLGKTRKVTTTYKGLTEEELSEIKRTQLNQIAEKKAQKHQEEMEEKYYQEYHREIQKTLSTFDAIEERKAIQNDTNLRKENQILKEEQNARKRYLENVVYTNTPTQDYYDQFNTTTR